MTIIVGAHFGDHVGVAGDTRAIRTHPSGQREAIDNALKIYQFPPYFVAAISGDAHSAISTLTNFYISNFVNVDAEEGYRHVLDPDWMREKLVESHNSPLSKPRGPFACIFAAENRLVDWKAAEPYDGSTGVIANLGDAQFSTTVASLQASDPEVDQRALFRVELPTGKLSVAKAGEVLTSGSGVSYQPLLRAETNVMAGLNFVWHDKFSALTSDIEKLSSESSSATFNAFSFGMAFGRGEIVSTLHGYFEWPSNGPSSDSYGWEPMKDDEGVPEMTPYAAGLDLAEINTGWIYRPEEKLRLRAISFLDPDYIAATRRDRNSLTL